MLKLDEFLEEQWLLHVSMDKKTFPRDVGIFLDFPKRRSIRSENAYLVFIREWYGKINLYTALFSDSMTKNMVVNKLYFDLDFATLIGDDVSISPIQYYEALQTVYEDMQKLVAYSVDKYSYEPRVSFSGSKGFSVYFDFKPLEIERRTITGHSESFRLLAEQIIAEAGIRSADRQVLGDTRRITRIPYTPNMNVIKGVVQPIRLCTPIDIGWSLDTILNNAKEVSQYHSVYPIAYCNEIRECLKEIDDKLEQMKRQPIVGCVPDRVKCNKELAKVMRFASHIYEGRKRLIHFVIVPHLIGSGMDAEKDTDKIVNWVHEFLRRTGAIYPEEYDKYILPSIRRTKAGNWFAWSFETFLLRYPELSKMFMVEQQPRFADYR